LKVNSSYQERTMASKKVTVVIDDLSGRELPAGEHETVSFSLDGVPYELDVSPTSAQRLRSTLDPYIRAGRKVNGTSRTHRKTNGTAAAAVRAWAAANGLEVSRRGRISTDIRALYAAANA
jgi:hypothetical protein